jgi:hypothetical protein
MQEACVLFLNKLKQKQREQNPLENKMRKTQYEKHNEYDRCISELLNPKENHRRGNGTSFFLQSYILITSE